MTSPARTYWTTRTGSTGASGLARHPVARLQLGREHDLDVGERLVRLRVLHDHHRRRPLLPVRALAVREADGPVPSVELVGEERLHDVLALVALGDVDGLGDQRHLGVA